MSNVIPMSISKQDELLLQVNTLAISEGISRVDAALQLKCYEPLKCLLWDSITSNLNDFSLDDEVLNIFQYCPDSIKGQLENIGEVIQFNKDTVFFHALATLSSASALSVKIKHHKNSDFVPLNGYFVSAHPPSTGKSAVHGFLSKARFECMENLNKENIVHRRKIKRRIRAAEREIEKICSAKDADSLNSEADIQKLEMDIYHDTQELKQYPIYTINYTDFTKESLRVDLDESNGSLVMLADEAGIMKSLFGNMYRAKGSTTENNLVLAGWQNQSYSVKRVGSANTERVSFEVKVNLVIGSLAQDVSIKTMLMGCLDGDGAAQRFLYYETIPTLGDRVHNSDRVLLPDDPFGELWRNVFYSDGIELTLDAHSYNYLDFESNKIESTMKSGGINSHVAMIGYVGKMKDHVIKLAGLFHLMEHFGRGGSRSTTIEYSSMVKAFAVFEASLHTYRRYLSIITGSDTDNIQLFVLQRLYSMAGSKLSPIEFTKFAQSNKNLKAFQGIKNFSKYLKQSILPELENRNILICREKHIYLNPQVAEMLADV